MTTVIVGVDRSDSSTRAVELAIRVARLKNGIDGYRERLRSGQIVAYK